MTAEERAGKLADWWWDAWELDRQVAHKGAALEVRMLLEAKITEAIRAAVAEEREACAQTADCYHQPKCRSDPPYRCGDVCRERLAIAARIRARGQS